jgi:NAD(P)-dependent dehydrogenase (short-subunit alcohol dehydrogenase family)
MPGNQSTAVGQETPVSVVVGGMHGLAGNITKAFYDNSHQVIVIDKRSEPDDAREKFFHHAIPANLLDTATLPALAQQIRDVYGRVTNLVFSLRYRGSEDTEWQGEFDLGLTVPKVLIEELTPSFTGGGTVILISSTAAHKVTSGLPISYHCIKSATEHMVRYYAWNLGAEGIRVNGIAPGYMVKDESVAFFMEDRKKVEKVNLQHPVGRFGRADDIANAASFLCSNDASFITGQILTVDGGLSLENPGYS